VTTPQSEAIYDEVANEDPPYQSSLNESKLHVVKPLFMYPVYSAKFSYVARVKEDLTVQKGDQMFLIDGSNKDWWYMILASTKKAGFIPTNYLTKDVCKVDEKQIQLVKKLENDSTGETWEGLCYGNALVAVKILPFAISSEKYLEEETSMTKLCHKNVVRFYAVCVERNYFITEFLTCGSLLQYLRQMGKSMRLPQLMENAAQIADGMAYLEAQNYAHGNLAARNILRTEDQICKVADYGIIPLALEDGKNRRKVSWPDKWTAPETVVYEVFTTKSDVWSYGIVLYEIITCGKIPYPAMSNAEVIERVSDGYRLPCPPACPRKLHNIMLSCWNINADDRPAFTDLQLSITDFTTDENIN
jgi:fyn-related kinase